MNIFRQQSGRRPASGPVCPACAAPLAANSQRCPSCKFTGADSMALFSDPPPLLPLLDAAELWSDADVRLIEAARGKLRRRFPQFRFHVCSVMLPPETSLPLFGFWLLNACPFHLNETADERVWTVLLLINARTGQVSAIPGYAAGHWIGDDDLVRILSAMAPAWKAGKTARAVCRFFNICGRVLDRRWKLRSRSKGFQP